MTLGRGYGGGSMGEVNITIACSSARQAGKASEGEGWTVGWRDEAMERLKGNW